MKSFLSHRTPLLLLFMVLGCSCVLAQSTDSNGPLTNAAVVKLVKAGFKEKTVITIIASRPARFDLSPDRMIELKRTGLSEKIILAMMARQEGTDIDDASFGDDGFFNGSSDSTDKNSAKSEKSNEGNSMDIFGSSGGLKSSSKSRGGSGSEAGGAAPKLEKTPSLTNDTVIELVEAGFSEGTIVRRIEKSPVAFDFAPEKLAELRKHRVTDKIIAAMKAAMGVEGNTGNTASPVNGTSKQ